MDKLLACVQHWDRKGGSTLMALTDLHFQIYGAFARNANLHSVFFDMGNVFLRIWRHLIYKALHKTGLKGSLRCLLISSLENHSFRVHVGSHFPSTSPQKWCLSGYKRHPLNVVCNEVVSTIASTHQNHNKCGRPEHPLHIEQPATLPKTPSVIHQ